MQKKSNNVFLYIYIYMHKNNINYIIIKRNVVHVFVECAAIVLVKVTVSDPEVFAQKV